MAPLNTLTELAALVTNPQLTDEQIGNTPITWNLTHGLRNWKVDKLEKPDSITHQTWFVLFVLAAEGVL
jgi:hypothetical protein